MNPLGRVDVPTDYQALWLNLKRRLGEMKAESAARMASSKDATVDDLRHYQGQWAGYDLVGAEMERLREEMLAEKRPTLRQLGTGRVASVDKP